MTALVDQLAAKLGASLDTRGRAHADCPYCGAPAYNRYGRAAYHFYIYELASGASGAKCWSCGQSWTLDQLASELSIERSSAPASTRRAPVQPSPAPWRADNALAHYRQYQANQWDRVVSIWQGYKPLDEYAIDSADLGIGRLPLWHEDRGWYLYRWDRLIVPLIENERIIGLRARAIDERDTGPKWLTGSTSQRMLAGLDDLAAGGRFIWVENLIDRLLAEQRQREQRAQKPIAFLASGGVSWDLGWLDRLVALNARGCIWFDNDLAGCPNARVYRLASWRWRNQQRERAQALGRPLPVTSPPTPRGWELAQLLRQRGLAVDSYAWPIEADEHSDIGSLLIAEA